MCCDATGLFLLRTHTRACTRSPHSRASRVAHSKPSVVIRPSFQFDDPLPDLSNVEDITFPFLLEDCIAWMMEKGTRLAFHIFGEITGAGALFSAITVLSRWDSGYTVTSSHFFFPILRTRVGGGGCVSHSGGGHRHSQVQGALRQRFVRVPCVACQELRCPPRDILELSRAHRQTLTDTRTDTRTDARTDTRTRTPLGTSRGREASEPVQGARPAAGGRLDQVLLPRA